jgi:hypothetical protein
MRKKAGELKSQSIERSVVAAQAGDRAVRRATYGEKSSDLHQWIHLVLLPWIVRH